MHIDPENAVVKLCAEGIQAEMKANIMEASDLYSRAWEIRQSDYESCIAAHYLARIQNSVEKRLHWNMEALNYADKVPCNLVESFYPSLYLNLGKDYEDLSDKINSKKYYELGEAIMNRLPDDRLGNITRDGIRRGLERIYAK